MGIHDKLYAAGEKMGFARGGQVKDTGLMPAAKGDSQQEIEAGGHGKLKPGYKRGGKPCLKPAKGKGKMAAKGVAKINALKKGKPTHSKKPMIGS